MRLIQHSLLTLASVLLLVSCGKDGVGKGAEGWYIGECAPTAEYIRNNGDPEMFKDPDNWCVFNDSGRMIQFWKKDEHFETFETYVIHISSSNVLEIYQGNDFGDPCWISKQDSPSVVGRTKLYMIDGWTLGKLAYYGDGISYVYTRDGDILTIKVSNETQTFVLTSGGLIMNGQPGKFKKFDPQTTY